MSRLEAKELRVGNLVYFKNTHDVAKVELIHNKHYDCRDEHGLFIPNGNYEAIPLSELHLIGLGFNNVRKNFLMNHKEFHNNKINEGAFYVETVGDAFNNWYLYHKTKMITSSIQYVHQLQNLYFALCGEELELI